MSESPPPKPKILVQLDSDGQPSVFDAVVAVDAGVDHLFRHGGVAPEAVRAIVHGVLFTRGVADLNRSALFIGGSNVQAGEAILEAVLSTFFGPFRVSVLHDPNGANTTASAAVLAIEQSLDQPERWDPIRATVLGAGPVGRRVAQLLAGLGARVQVGAPDLEQAAKVAEQSVGRGAVAVEPFSIDGDWLEKIKDSSVIIAAGPAGVEILPAIDRDRFPDLRVAIDLNAVPPHGLGGLKPTDGDKDRDGVRVWGALGVGGLKMKIHKAVLRSLFDGEPTIFALDQVFEVGRRILLRKT